MGFVIKYILILFNVLIFSQNTFALLNVSGQGTSDDRKELVLHYTFDKIESNGLILNQIHKNDLTHPTHLKVYGNPANIEFVDNSVNFIANSVLSPADRRRVFAKVGSKVGNETITLDLKKDIARKLFGNLAYLKSQGAVSFNSLCTSNEELTIQTFMKPKRVNYSPQFASIASLRALETKEYSFFASQRFQRGTVYSGLATRVFYNLDNDLDDSGKGLNESVYTFKTGGDINSYHLLHKASGKEGWLSKTLGVGNKKVLNIANSHLLIGHGHFPYGEGIENIKTGVGAVQEDSVIKNYISYNTTGYVGSIQQFAVYCRYIEQAEVLGGEYTDTTKIKVTPELDSEPTQSEKVAVRLLSLITKKKIPIDAGIVKEAAEYIDKGDYKKAALIGVELPDFYNNTVKDFALQMSNREETVDAPLNDMTATIIGVVRDQVNAKKLLTGNFYYRANPLVGVPSDTERHMLRTNLHYEGLDKGLYDLKKALVKSEPQMILGAGNKVVSHPDPAGVLTSRAFLSAHAVAGTNRRQVEFAFKQFMCVNLSEMADTEASDIRVGRDIDRFPAGSHKKYQTSCKGCHTVMDGFRGAFSKTDFDIKNTFVKYGDFHSMHTKKIGSVTYRYPAGVSFKVNHNEFSYPNGFVTSDDSFHNFANRGANKILFGWRSPVSKGYGMGQFGKMLSESERFSKCMVKKVFESICPVKISETTLAKLNHYVTDFEKTNYNMKNLFLNAAISPLCLGNN